MWRRVDDVPEYLARRKALDKKLQKIMPPLLTVFLVVFFVVVLHYLMGHGPLSPWLPGQ